MKSTRFKRQTLALFFIVSLVPALIVAAVWYVDTQLASPGSTTINIHTFILPVFLLGVIPALLLSYVFAELLARPVRALHEAVLRIASGDYSKLKDSSSAGEFSEITLALDQVATQLTRKISEAESETALIESERNKLRGVLNSMTDGVFALDRDGRIILFNKAASELTGRSITEVAGQLAEKVMPFRQGGELVMTRWLATQAGRDQVVGSWRNLELYRANGESLYVDVQAIVLPKDPNGISALVTFHDLTKNRQLEEMKIDFVALAAHELRTPLTEVKGYLDILQHEATRLSKADREFLDRAVAGANQLGELMNNLLNVARIEHGELNYHPVHLDYLAFIEEHAQNYERLVSEKERTFELKLPANLPTITADESGLNEVINNLITNALAYTQIKTGKITLTVKRHRDEIETSVSDNGSGIPSSAIPHLFTKFYRVEEMKAKTRGTGLGLYISRAIIEAHGGHIWVDSEEGKGSTFTFRIPLRALVTSANVTDNKTIKITRGAHGWIKNNTLH
jgi:PAS domain S-box-containing protein